MFLPAGTVFDGKLAGMWQKNRAIFWVVDVVGERDGGGGERVVRGTGEMCSVYYGIGDGQEAETFLFY